MLDIRFVRENPDVVKENIRKKFQDSKLPLVDEVIRLDAEYRAAIGEASDLRANRNKLSKQIGMLMGQAKKDPAKAAEAEEVKKQVTAQADRLKELEAKVGFAARYRRVQEKLEELEQLVVDARFECTGPYAKLTTTEYAATLTKMLGIIRSMDEVNES